MKKFILFLLFVFSFAASGAPQVSKENGEISNLGLATSLSSNALTISLKTKLGSTPSGGDPVAVAFRSSTITSGIFLRRQAIASTSVVLSSGSTLGHMDGVEGYLWVYAIDNAGTIELAVSSSYFKDNSIQNTTAEGGSGGADSAGVLYSTTSRSSVPVRLIGYIRSTQSTAGLWASAISEVLTPPIRSIPIRAFYFASTTRTPGAATQINLDTKVYDSHGIVTTGSSWKMTAPEAGDYLFIGNMGESTATSPQVDIYKNGSLYFTGLLPLNTVVTALNYAIIITMAVGDYVDFRTSGSGTIFGTSLFSGGSAFVQIRRLVPE